MSSDAGRPAPPAAPSPAAPRGEGRIVVVGAALLELRFTVEHLPTAGDDVLARGLEVRVGGSAVNVARTLKGLGLASLLVIHRGEGPFDRMVGRELARLGLRVQGRRSRRRSGVTVTLVEPSGERSLVSALGVEVSVGALDLPRDVGRARALYVSGYELAASEDLEAAVAALPPRVLVLMDPGPRGARPGAVGRAWARADVVRLNAREAAERSGEPDPEASARELGRRRPTVVSTPEGAFAADPDGVRFVAAGRRSTGDTTGAGDAHAAGLLAGLLSGLDLAGATALANQVAREQVLAGERQDW